MITIKVDHKLRISRSELPTEVEGMIREALSIPNIERQHAMEQHIWGWQQMPEKIYLWGIDGEDLIMPRGFLPSLCDGLEAEIRDWVIEDRRTWQEAAGMPVEPIVLRSWQAPAVRAIRLFEQGIWRAPAGSGKTVAVLETIRRLGGQAIVLVNTKDILWQWKDRAERFLGEGFRVGQIGDGVFEVGDHLTIATSQTLHSRFESLEVDGFFDRFSFLCLDECHHATAETYNRLVDRFSARYRIGVSATPDKTGDFQLATSVLGPIFHVTDKKDVDSIVEPEIYKVSTNFSFGFRSRKGRQPSNYAQLLDELTRDEERNELIVKALLMNEGAHALVISKRLEHLETIEEMLKEFGYENRIFMLTGETSSEVRKAIVNIANAKPCVILSTLADEALDIPRLDSLFLIFPQRNAGLIEQQVGRICRVHPDKTEVGVFDFADSKVNVLDNQWKERRRRVYQAHGYNISVINAEDVLAYDLAEMA